MINLGKTVVQKHAALDFMNYQLQVRLLYKLLYT